MGVAAKVSRWGGGSGVFIGVMERIRWCRPCGWDSALGCRSIFCHVMDRCGSRFAVVRIGGVLLQGCVGSTCIGHFGVVVCGSVG